VAVITQVIHYGMGGLEVDLNSSVIAINGKAITGLYAAGELAETSMVTNALAVTRCSIVLDLTASLANMRRRTCSALA
jgi:succinate dehydrogenase/fumarate reductase flavoprotein subunit